MAAALRLLLQLLLLHAAALLVCSMAHHLFALMPLVPSDTAGSAAADRAADHATADRLCAGVCDALHSAMAAAVSASAGWLGGPSAGWLRDRGQLFNPDGYHESAAAAAAPG